MAITINGTLSLDESAGLQTGGVAVGDEDNNDSDVTLATLLSEQSTFYDRLFDTVINGGLALPTTFATNVSVAKSAADFISVSGDVTSLGFVDGDGDPLPTYGGADPGVATGLTALDGGSIVLFADDTLGDRLVLGVDEDGDIVFAVFMDPAADLTTARVWMVQFEPLSHGDDTDDDDPDDLFDALGVAAGSTLEFNFDSLPSGSNLFGVVGDPGTGLIVIGKDIQLKADGTYISNKTMEVKTSQAGEHATIGIESQMFDPGDAAYFTFVNDPEENFLGFNLSSTEADDADNISYGSTLEGDSAFVKVAQLQSGATPSMSIKCFNIADTPQGRDFIAAKGVNDAGANPLITDVRVYNASGTLIESFSAPVANNGLTITIVNGVATVTGFGENYRIEWDTNQVFDQVLISGVSGKFDIGGFGLSESVTTSVDIGDALIFEDDGPSVDIELKGTADLTVDESSLAPPAPVAPTDSITAGDLFDVVSESFGTDGEGASGTSYKLVLGADTTSGLFDTDTNLEVILSIDATETLISGKVNDGGLVDVFTIEIDPVTGTVTLTQYRPMVNGDPTDPDEADTPLTLAAGTVSVQKTLTDGDDDAASDTVDISSIFNFRDDGPTQPDAGEDVDNLVTDDTSITDSAVASTDDIFPDPPNFGADGPRATDPIVISLRLDDPAPGDGDDPDSGLVDTETGDAIRFVTVGDDIVGYVDLDGDGVISLGEKVDDNEAVRYSLVANGGAFDVTFTQTRAVYHQLAETEVAVAANTVFVERNAFDGDGDPADSVDFDVGEITFILDDEPAIGPISDGLVDFEKDDFVTNSLEGVVGNDPNSAPYTLTSYTTDLTINGVDLKAVPDGDDTVGYWADTDGDTVFGSAGDTEYYRMVLGDQSGEGNYTFTVLVAPPAPDTEFNFDDLPSGSNLFGIVGDADAGLVIFGRDIGLKADNTYIANLTQEVKTSQAGLHDTIGIESQMFDPGDAAYFTFVTNPDPDFTGTGLGSTEADDADNIKYGSTLEGDSAFIRIAQLQSGATPSMSIQLYNIDDDDPQGKAMLDARGINETGKDPDITDVRVYDANDVLIESFSAPVANNGLTISITNGIATVTGFGTNYKIEWDADEDFDQTLITGVAGKFDIGGFGFSQGNDTPDQFLQFTAQVTDGDGDTASDSWNIGIDGTGQYDDDHVDNVSII